MTASDFSFLINGSHTTKPIIAQTTDNTKPCQLSVAITPLKPTGVGNSCWKIIFRTKLVEIVKYATFPEANGAKMNGTIKFTL